MVIVELQGEGEQSGIIPRLCKDLFVRIDKDSDSEFSVEVKQYSFFFVFETVGDAVSCVGEEVANIRSGAKVVSDIAAQPPHTGELHGNLLRTSSRPAEPEQQGQLEGEGAPAARPLRGGPEQAGGEQLPGHPRLDGGGEQVEDGGGDQHERELEQEPRRLHDHLHSAQARQGQWSDC